MSIEQKSKYVAPSTQRVTVELEQGFMATSVYETAENTEGLTIKDQQVQDDVFDFSNKDQWKQ